LNTTTTVQVHVIVIIDPEGPTLSRALQGFDSINCVM
jgi:hypothetical protein